jgi:hypothetical protein
LSKETKLRLGEVELKIHRRLKIFILFPKLDFPISKEKGLIDTYYAQNKKGTKISLDQSDILNMLDN